MEEETKVSSEVPVMKVVENTQTADAPKQEKPLKKEDEESNFDGDFIKVEKETPDMKDMNSQTVEARSAEIKEPSVSQHTPNNESVTRELLEAREKLKELEFELERVAGSLKHSESENAQLKHEISVTKEQSEQSVKKYELLEADHKKIQEQMLEAQEKFNQQLKTLQEALEDQVSKHKELVGIKESFDSLNLELEGFKNKTQVLEQELQASAAEKKKYEELHRESGSVAESETKRAQELEKLLEVSKASAKEMEDRMASLQEELKSINKKVAENEKVESALTSTTMELTAAQEELQLTKGNLLELEKKLSSKEVVINETAQELDVLKASEKQMRENISAMDSSLSSTKDELKAKVAALVEVESRLKKEVAARESVEATLNSQEGPMLKAQEELAKVVKEKEALEATVTDLSKSLSQMKEKWVDLEAKLQNSEQKCGTADKELREYSEKLTELQNKLNKLETEKEDVTGKISSYQQKITDLESALSQSKLKNTELVEELKNVSERCTEHEGRANATHQRSLELEDLFQSSHSKFEASDKRVRDLELLLDTEKHRIQELEQQITSLEQNCGLAEAEARKYPDTVAELTLELEKFRASSSGLEKALQGAKDKEIELTKALDIATAEKKKSEDALMDSNKRLHDTENLLEILRNELDMAQGKFKNIEDELKAAGMKETELMEKLKSAESQVEQQAKFVEVGKVRIAELESQNQTLIKDSELKYQEAMANFSNRDIEANSLLEKLKLLEDQIQRHEEQAVESAYKNASLMEELQQCSKKLSALETSNEELKKIVLESNNKAAQSSSEIELLMETNTQLKDKVNELQKLLESNKAHEEVSDEKLASQTSTIKELQEKLSHYEAHSGSLAEVNMKLTNELAESELKLNDLQGKLSAAVLEKEMTVEEQYSSKKAIEDLTLQLSNERQRLQSELSTITEEKNQLHAAYMEAKKGRESVTVQLEEQLEAYKLKEEALNAEIKERSSSEAKLKELEEKLHLAEAQLKKVENVQAEAASRVESLTSQIEDYKLKVNDGHTLDEKVLQLEQELQLARVTITDLTKQKEEDCVNASQLEGTRKKLSEEVEAKNRQVVLLEKQIKELEQLASSLSSEKESKQETEVEVKSRDIGSILSTPTKRKNKKSEKSSAEATTSSSSSGTQTQTGEASSLAMNLKIVLGVALVSIIFGVILGKRY